MRLQAAAHWAGSCLKSTSSKWNCLELACRKLRRGVCLMSFVQMSHHCNPAALKICSPEPSLEGRLLHPWFQITVQVWLISSKTQLDEMSLLLEHWPRSSLWLKDSWIRGWPVAQLQRLLSLASLMLKALSREMRDGDLNSFRDRMELNQGFPLPF